MARLRFIGLWTATSIAGETSAVIAASFLAATTFVAVGLVVLLEALVLGVAQARLLGGVRRGIGRGWLAATIVGVGIGRFVQFATTMTNGNSIARGWPLALHYLSGVELGILVGACMAVPQAFVLMRDVGHVGWWIAARAGAWAIGVPLLMFGGETLSRWPNADPGAVVLAALGLFASVAAIVGAIEGVVMERLLNGQRSRTTVTNPSETTQGTVRPSY
ncbi:MAG TPA: hypothetical protein VMA36_15665 [Candidatus Limnocylindria bacterium]|jgi:hypothetical protein|nr:hypothetical protein [Candidatus Limnocylindria bacterium]